MSFGTANIGTYFVDIVPNMSKFGSEMRSQASTSGSKFGSLFSNAFTVAIGNLAADAFTSLVGGFGDIVQAGMDASDAMARFEQTMGFAGVTGSEFDAARAAAKAYADETVYSLDTILNTTAQLASNGVANYESLMEAAGNLNAIAGGNANSFDAVALALTQVNGAGRLTTQDFNQLVNAIPGASGQLQQALADMGAFDAETMNFRDAMAAGEISAEEFNAAIMNLGMSDAAQEAATSTDTFEGSIGNFQAAIENLSMGVMDAFAPAITGIINGLTSLVDKAAPYFAAAADAFSDFIADVQTAFGDLKTVVMPYIQDFVRGAQTAWGNLQSVLSSDTMQGALDGLRNGVSALADSLGPFYENVLVPLGNVLFPIIGTELGLLVENVTTVAGAIASFVSVVVERITTWAQFFRAAIASVQALFSALPSAVQAIFSNVLAIVQGVPSQIVGFFSGIGGKILDTFKGADSVKDIFSGIVDFISGIPGEIVGFFSGLGSRITSAIGSIHFPTPHITWESLNIAGVSVVPLPHVSWYGAGGMTNGAVLFGAGERGAELVWPSYSPYLEKYADAIASRINAGGVYINAQTCDDAQVLSVTRRYLADLQRLGAI